MMTPGTMPFTLTSTILAMLLFALSLIWPVLAVGQSENPFALGAHFTNVRYNNTVGANYYGVNLELRPYRNLRVHYAFSFGTDSRGGHVYHIPAGVYLAGEILSLAFRNDDEFCDGAFDDCEEEESFTAWYVIGSLICAVLPEGVSYDVNLNSWLRLSPFLSLLGVEIVDNGSESRAYWSNDIGCRVQAFSENGFTVGAIFFHRSLPDANLSGNGWGLEIAFRL